MSDPPTVSVVMAVYNTERYLVQAVESILGQTFRDFEFVIIDDGSTDRSLKILQKYAATDDRIHLISRENRGIPKTRNELLAHSTGEFIAVMDSDDIAMPDRLARQVEFLRQHPEVVCVGSAQDRVDEAGRLLFTQVEPEEDLEIQQWMLRGYTSINNPSAMIRRAAIVKVGGYDESLPQAEDLDFFLKLGEIGKLANFKESLIQYRQHQQSISETKQCNAIEWGRKACERAWQRRGIHGNYDATQPWRPHDRPSRHDYILKYGWSFFNRGQRWAAIVYGIRAIRTLPLKLEGWKLLICALVKPSPSQPLL